MMLLVLARYTDKEKLHDDVELHENLERRKWMLMTFVAVKKEQCCK